MANLQIPPHFRFRGHVRCYTCIFLVRHQKNNTAHSSSQRCTHSIGTFPHHKITVVKHFAVHAVEAAQRSEIEHASVHRTFIGASVHKAFQSRLHRFSKPCYEKCATRSFAQYDTIEFLVHLKCLFLHVWILIICTFKGKSTSRRTKCEMSNPDVSK